MNKMLGPVWDKGKAQEKNEGTVPEERKCIRMFGTKEPAKSFPEEWQADMYFWRNEKMSSELRESFRHGLRPCLLANHPFLLVANSKFTINNTDSWAYK